MDVADVRSVLLSKGVRTLAVEFAGSNDEGEVINTYRFPNDPMMALLQVAPDVESIEIECHFKKDAATSKIIADLDVDETLADMFYTVLHNFQGDWVNNAGGWGMVALDLLTSDYVIDGYQRFEDCSVSYTQGTLGAPIDDVPLLPMDMAAILKTTLGM